VPPASAFDADGFLARKFYAADATHSNPEYGELMLRKIERRYGEAATVEKAKP
jgi:hypothetical protein